MDFSIVLTIRKIRLSENVLVPCNLDYQDLHTQCFVKKVMVLQRVTIEFTDRANPVYTPGELVSGNVVFQNPDFEKLSGKITLRFRGKSHTIWYDDDMKTNVEKQEYYVDTTCILFPVRGGYESNDDVFPFGTHYFPFSFRIPDNAPCSFEGCHGWVRYVLYAKLEIPSEYNKEKKAFITVLPVADLNTDARAKVIPKENLEEDAGFFHSRPILANVSCNKGGYVPGEIITIHLDIENKSRKDITAVKVFLEQKATFYATTLASLRKKVSITEAARVKEKRIIKDQSRERFQMQLPVPSLPPSDLPGCSIIDLQFRLQFKIQCGSFRAVFFKLPIVIGTVPLDAPGFSDNPPTYLECVFGSVDGRENNDEELVGGTDYAPLYKYYAPQ